MDNFKSGALIDNRPIREKEKDYKFEEMVSSPNPVTWIEKPQSEWRRFPIFNQDGSGSCVAQTMRKLLGILWQLKKGTFLNFSASHIYKRRYNKPYGGMAGEDVYKIAQKGTVLNEVAPSDNLNDAQMDNVPVTPEQEKVGEQYAIKNYVTIPVGNIDTLASIIQTTGKGLMLWTYWKYDEWLDVPIIKYPNLDLYASGTSRHSVAGVDFTLYKGEKAIVIDESWDKLSTGMNGQRVLTESFLNKRNYYASYPIDFKFETSTVKPKYTFTRTMKFSPIVSYNNEVVCLQNVLKYEGFFPTNINSTGYFGSITKKGVILFQKKYGLVGDGIVGPKTRKVLNDIYSI